MSITPISILPFFTERALRVGAGGSGNNFSSGVSSSTKYNVELLTYIFLNGFVIEPMLLKEAVSGKISPDKITSALKLMSETKLSKNPSPGSPIGPLYPRGPVNPSMPGRPCSPLGPVGPICPSTPLDPRGPVTPSIPSLPSLPCGPVNPVSPLLPV